MEDYLLSATKQYCGTFFLLNNPLSLHCLCEKNIYLIYSMHIAVGFHVPDDAAAAVEDLCLAVPSLSSVDHIPLFLGVEFRTKIAYAEGLLGIKTHFAYAQNRGGKGHGYVEVDAITWEWGTLKRWSCKPGSVISVHYTTLV